MLNEDSSKILYRRFIIFFSLSIIFGLAFPADKSDSRYYRKPGISRLVNREQNKLTYRYEGDRKKFKIVEQPGDNNQIRNDIYEKNHRGVYEFKRTLYTKKPIIK